MVHLDPDANGEIKLGNDPFRAYMICENFDREDDVTVTATRGGSVITMPPRTRLMIPDRVSLLIQGENSHRNFVCYVLDIGSDV